MNRVRVTRVGGVGRVTLARPEKKNALDRQMVDEIAQALESLAAETETRVILLDAEGDDFCAGADLEALEALLDADRDAQLDDARALGRVFTTIRQLRLPVVVAVRGRAFAGGAGLATACDLVLAHPNAVFNGELYNFRELRDELAAAGHTLRGTGDTVVIPHLYEEHGDAFVERLEG